MLRRDIFWKFLVGVLIALSLAIVDLFVGAEQVSPLKAFLSDGFAREILMNFRLPKLMTAILAGIALSVSGLVMQTIFRNPLAGPYMLGVSSGASLGVAIFMMSASMVGYPLVKMFGTVTSAWIGSAVVLVIVMAVSVRLRDVMAILILGMMIGSAATAFVDVLQFFSNESALKGFVLWSMGSVGGLSMLQISILFFSVIFGLAITLCKMKVMDVMLLGENYASTMGVNMVRNRTMLFLSTALMAGGVTAFCGPIAFVGIASPHIARIVWKRAPHRILLPASLLTGTSLMIICDILSSVPMYGYPLPLNTVTALFGIPVVVAVVWKGNRSQRIM